MYSLAQRPLRSSESFSSWNTSLGIINIIATKLFLPQISKGKKMLIFWFESIICMHDDSMTIELEPNFFFFFSSCFSSAIQTTIVYLLTFRWSGFFDFHAKKFFFTFVTMWHSYVVCWQFLFSTAKFSHSVREWKDLIKIE